MKIDRRTYADHYGPTTGDRIRLADTDLDHRRSSTTAHVYGDEAKFGGGKVIRDGMGQSPTATRARRRARPRHHQRRHRRRTRHLQGRRRHPRRPDLRDRQGRESRASWTASRRASRSARRPKSSPAKGTSSPPAAIDSHVHFISPNQIPDAFYSGITTLIGGGTGPATGTKATTCTPGAWNIRRMYEAVEAFPLNFGFLGKGNASAPERAARADSRRRARPEAARGLGHDAGRDRSVPARSPTSSTSRWRFTPTR